MQFYRSCSCIIIIGFMNLTMDVGSNEHHYKQQYNSNSTIDAQSVHQQPYFCWQPIWCEITDYNTYSNALKICPDCSKFVHFTQPKQLCQNFHSKCYLAHAECIGQIIQFTQYTHPAKIFSAYKAPMISSPSIGCRQYFFQLALTHPLSARKFFSVSTKILECNNTLSIPLSTNLLYNPNIIPLPLSEYKCTVKITAISTQQAASCQPPSKPTSTLKKSGTLSLPLAQSFSQHSEQHRQQQQKILYKINLLNKNGIQYAHYKQGTTKIVCQFQVVHDEALRAKVVDGMNFKYPHRYLSNNPGKELEKETDIEKVDFIILRAIWVQFGSQGDQNRNQKYDQVELSSPSHQNDIKTFESMSQINPQLDFTPSQPISLIPQPSLSTPCWQLPADFLAQLKTHSGSKQFQKKVKTLAPASISCIISHILPHLSSLIVNQYANYMFQSLLSICTYEQRMRIVLEVESNMGKLVRTREGTFVFQQFVMLMTREEEFGVFVRGVKEEFKDIAMDCWGNHFMRKLVQYMPKVMIGEFMGDICDGFVELARNKNAVCVMKCVIRALKQGQSLSPQLSHYMKKFLDNLTIHTASLLNDEYGNYLLQQAFQLLPSDRLSGISSYIITNFAHFSCQKFSTNVLQNCIKKYFPTALFPTLKQSLQSKHILYMYNNKQGNKILLDILQLGFETGLKDKISAVVRNQGTSKYNGKRWMAICKAKTGAVGGVTSWSQAVEMTKGGRERVRRERGQHYQ